jgi:outer membrane protein assembly factor BamB
VALAGCGTGLLLDFDGGGADAGESGTASPDASQPVDARGVGADAGTDVRLEASADASAEVATDALSEGSADAGTDVLLEASGDVSADVVTDALLETSPDASAGPADSSLDVAPEGSPDAPSDSPLDSPADAPSEADGASCSPIVPTGSKAVAYQITPEHDGAQPGDQLSLPLCRRWSTALGGSISYALVADGRVFVTYARNGVATLVALDEHTGAQLWGPALLGGTYGRANAAYDNGSVFTLNYSGAVEAFAAASGQAQWNAQLPGQYAFSSPPTARAGVIYAGGAGSGGTVYALPETGGSVAWSASVMNGDESSPAVTADAVFVSYACNQAYSFSLAGALNWHHSGPCEGGGGKTVAILGGNVYTRDNGTNLVLDAATGNQIGTFASTPIPAGAAGTGYFVAGGQLYAIPLGQSTAAWTFPGDSALVTAPLVVGHQIIVGSSAGNVYVVDATSGTQVSTDRLPAAIPAPDEQNVGSPLTGLSAADGMLFVPDGDTLYAY